MIWFCGVVVYIVSAMAHIPHTQHTHNPQFCRDCEATYKNDCGGTTCTLCTPTIPRSTTVAPIPSTMVIDTTPEYPKTATATIMGNTDRIGNVITWTTDAIAIKWPACTTVYTIRTREVGITQNRDMCTILTVSELITNGRR